MKDKTGRCRVGHLPAIHTGAPCRIRTYDLLLRRQTLYPLSQGGSSRMEDDTILRQSVVSSMSENPQGHVMACSNTWPIYDNASNKMERGLLAKRDSRHRL